MHIILNIIYLNIPPIKSLKPLPPNVYIWFKKRVHGKNSYERRAYESVDDVCLS